jgi:hypothetical protein
VDESAAPEMRGQGGQPGISFDPAKKRRISQLEPALTPIAIALCFPHVGQESISNVRKPASENRSGFSSDLHSILEWSLLSLVGD